jgi:hypothetical protein
MNNILYIGPYLKVEAIFKDETILEDTYCDHCLAEIPKDYKVNYCPFCGEYVEYKVNHIRNEDPLGFNHSVMAGSIEHKLFNEGWRQLNSVKGPFDYYINTNMASNGIDLFDLSELELVEATFDSEGTVKGWDFSTKPALLEFKEKLVKKTEGVKNFSYTHFQNEIKRVYGNRISQVCFGIIKN